MYDNAVKLSELLHIDLESAIQLYPNIREQVFYYEFFMLLAKIGLVASVLVPLGIMIYRFSNELESERNPWWLGLILFILSIAALGISYYLAPDIHLIRHFL